MSGTTSTIVGDLITQALKMTGAVPQGQTPSAEDSNDALIIANQMLAAWNAKRWDVYGLVDVSVVASGAISYTIGTGADFDTPRVDRLEAAYMVQTVPGTAYPVSYPLELLNAYEDYVRIAVKNIPSFAQYCFYDAAYPVGNIYFWPVPYSDQFTLHVLVKEPLGQFAGLSQEIALPPDYLEAVLYNLVVRLKPMYGMAPDQTVTGLAKSALNTIQNSNAQVPRMRLDKRLSGSGRTFYNAFSDNN